MNIRLGQYFEFENKIAKINKMEGHKIKLRNFSYGTTKNEYSYQSIISSRHLFRLIRTGKAKAIAPEIIMQMLLNKLIKKKK